MNRKSYYATSRLAACLLAASIALMPLSALGQTKINYHPNKYKPSDDVKLGQQAATEAERQLPLLHDPEVTSYVEGVGQRLVAAIPPEFQHPEFTYSFKVVNARDINAFALPGGSMFVNRGMIEAAHNEGEMAGVMAHELSHVALRHGTAQLTKAQKYSILEGIAGVAGTVLGGPGLGQMAEVPFAVHFLKFSREYETEADLMGARIMSRAGYDPHDLANMFRTLERQGGGGGGFLSDHPSSSNRYARINQEAQYLPVSHPIRDNGEFARIQARLHGYSKAPSMAEIQRNGNRNPNGGEPSPSNSPSSAPTGRVEYPSSHYRTYSEFGVLSVNIPDNWLELPEGNSVWFAPRGAYGDVGGQPVFTHGVSFGAAQSRSGDLGQATNDLVNGLAQGNRNLRQHGDYQRTSVGGREGLSVSFNNTNEATGHSEAVNLFTTQLNNGSIFYMITVTPENESHNYQNTFRNILHSIQLKD